ncbi:MAG: N-acetyltransferase [Methanomicrobiales archaeon]|nr:N-acetyltransferase [Methanomicrobiales archaeon]
MEYITWGGKIVQITVRPAGIRDIETIAENNRAMARETEGRELDPPIVRRGVEAVIRDPARGFYLLAEHEGEVVGQCMVTFEWSDWRCGTFWWIQSVYVRGEWRRRGIFRRLFGTLAAQARSRPDVAGLRLYVRRENRAAQAAYRSAGMEETRYAMFETVFQRGDPASPPHGHAGRDPVDAPPPARSGIC